MKFLHYLLMIIGAFLCLHANAISVPQARLMMSSPGDTTIKQVSAPAHMSGVAPKQGFFSRLKIKFLGFVIKRKLLTPKQADKKATLGWISVCLTLVGLGLLFSAGGWFSLVLVLAGVVLGVKSVIMKREPAVEKEKKVKKDTWFKRNLWWLILLTLIIGGIGALAIAWGSARFG
jgi:hypothetical protein